MILVVEFPTIVSIVPGAGLMVMVLAALVPAIGLIVIGNASSSVDL